MRRTMLSGTAAIALAALLSMAPGIADADTQTGTDTQTNTTDTQADTTAAPETQTEPVTDTGETDDDAVTTQAEMDAQAGVDAAELIGDSVENSAGDVLGDIETLVVGSDGTIDQVIVGVGGFLGIGEKEVAVPWDRFTVDAQENRLVANVSREELEALPDFEWPENYQTGTLIAPTPGDQTATTDVTDDTATDETAEQTAADQNSDATTTETTTTETTDAAVPLQPLDSVLAGNLIGAQIIAANGEEIGEVDDVVLSADGTAQGVVTEIGGFLGIDEKQVLLSWSDIDVRQDSDGDVVLQVQLDATALEAMPNYDYQASN